MKQFSFAGYTWPRAVAMLPRGTMAERAKNRKSPATGGYYHAPAPITASRGAGNASFYLESDFMPGLRWAWCDEIPGDWDEEQFPPEIGHKGWFIDEYRDDVLRGIVFKLPKGRGFLAGFSMGEGMISEIDREIYRDVVSAGFAADSMAENMAELNRERETDGAE